MAILSLFVKRKNAVKITPDRLKTNNKTRSRRDEWLRCVVLNDNYNTDRHHYANVGEFYFFP